ncbi:MAG: pyridoxamine 5'-phosphate oxidase family protein [Actinomycetota bacterium]
MDKKEVKSKIKELLYSQRLAVLATQSRDFPYTSIIVFWASADLSYIIFATSRDTRKFSYMAENRLVSLLVDDRRDRDDLFKVSAVTAIGEVEVVGKNDGQYPFFLKKNPRLKGFLSLPSVAMVRVNIIKYYLVTEIDKVYQLSIQ